MTKLKAILFVAFFLVLTLNSSAQTTVDETQKPKERAEKFLQTVREEKWDETYMFVIICKTQKGKVIKESVVLPEKFEEETREKIAERFRKLYKAPKPGKIVRVRFKENDKTTALIEYKHEDLDGFDMVLIDGEWYYTIEYLK